MITLMRKEFLLFSILILLALSLTAYYVTTDVLWSLIILGPLLILGFYDFFQTKRAIARNFPIVGRTRYLAEWLRPKMYQYLHP